ncbi:expressed unknown protein [Seminavis robusta]|uniref:Uncharacterized protein n=1 Tax=Seminavis robusta TaxID=568900 RepID=A0A9N8DMN0_9STRA|nr:expressed unknown protein [Seminavis robusta]|eukprot:Sro211_g087860.1 n/a (644) ;mRNA; f:21479-23410
MDDNDFVTELLTDSMERSNDDEAVPHKDIVSPNKTRSHTTSSNKMILDLTTTATPQPLSQKRPVSPVAEIDVLPASKKRAVEVTPDNNHSSAVVVIKQVTNPLADVEKAARKALSCPNNPLKEWKKLERLMMNTCSEGQKHAFGSLMAAGITVDYLAENMLPLPLDRELQELGIVLIGKLVNHVPSAYQSTAATTAVTTAMTIHDKSGRIQNSGLPTLRQWARRCRQTRHATAVMAQAVAGSMAYGLVSETGPDQAKQTFQEMGVETFANLLSNFPQEPTVLDAAIQATTAAAREYPKNYKIVKGTLDFLLSMEINRYNRTMLQNPNSMELLLKVMNAHRKSRKIQLAGMKLLLALANHDMKEMTATRGRDGPSSVHRLAEAIGNEDLIPTRVAKEAANSGFVRSIVANTADPELAEVACGLLVHLCHSHRQAEIIGRGGVPALMDSMRSEGSASLQKKGNVQLCALEVLAQLARFAPKAVSKTVSLPENFRCILTALRAAEDEDDTVQWKACQLLELLMTKCPNSFPPKDATKMIDGVLRTLARHTHNERTQVAGLNVLALWIGSGASSRRSNNRSYVLEHGGLEATETATKTFATSFKVMTAVSNVLEGLSSPQVDDVVEDTEAQANNNKRKFEEVSVWVV